MNELILLIILLGVTAFNTVFVTILFLRSKAKKAEVVEKSEQILEEAQKKADEIVQKAVEQADKIVSGTKQRGEKVTEEQKQKSETLEVQYEEQLRTVVEDITKQLRVGEKKAEEMYTHFVEEMQKNVSQGVELNQKALQEKADDALGKTQQQIDQFVDDVQGRVRKQIDEQVDKAHEAIEQYKRQRMEVVDTNAVQILEKALAITLGKKLPLSDQVDLVYQALEKAREEGFFSE